VLLYREADGTVPLLDWLGHLTERARTKCLIRVERLRELGHELRRPEADYLRDGIHELRANHAGVNLRMLYSFRKCDAVVTHGLVKQRPDVPPGDIDLAIRRMKTVDNDPEKHTYEE
jgi:phage-related protein